MQSALSNEMLERSELLADALSDTIAELRLIDAGDMVAYIRNGQWANISDLVQSSAELFFKDGAITFACAADYEMSWNDGPSITLDLELQTGELTTFFALTIGPDHSAVRIKNILYSAEPKDRVTATHIFARSLAAVRSDATPARNGATR